MIALVIPWSTASPGGVSTVVREVSREWALQGLAHKVLVDNWNCPKPEERSNELWFRVGAVAVPVGFLGVLRWLSRLPLALWRLHRFLRAQGITGINFHYTGLNALGVAVLKLLGVYRGRLVLSFHGTDVRPVNRSIERFLYGLIWQQASTVTACSQALVDLLILHHPACRTKCKVAYNGVDTDAFRPREGNGDSKMLGKPYGISIGGHVPLKGHEILIRAYAEIQNTCGCDLVIIGASGPQFEASVLLGQDLAIDKRLHVLRDQPKSSVAAWLRDAQWMIQPSRSEAFGLAVLEAAACAVPVAVSDVGGHREIVSHGITGLLFQPDSVEACMRALTEIIEQPSAAGWRASILRKEVLERFTWSRLASQLSGYLLH